MRRIESVDVIRVIGILAVMGLHTSVCFGPNECGRFLNTAALFNQVERFAVPFFFMVSGYFWANKCRDQSDFWLRAVGMSKRILQIFVAWGLLYAVIRSAEAFFAYGPTGPLKVAFWVIHGLNFVGLISVMLEGTKIHLWFRSRSRY
jgi:surface polysaccharide O-acyltransferase-like enzyme